METNIKLILLVVVLSIILVYPLGHIINQLFLHELGGGGLDVGLDNSSVDILIGFMLIPPFLSPLIFGIYGKDKWKWVVAIILALPSIKFVIWLDLYVYLPLISFVAGLTFALGINLIKNKSPQLKNSSR